MTWLGAKHECYYTCMLVDVRTQQPLATKTQYAMRCLLTFGILRVPSKVENIWSIRP